jgi:hypothetical protein
LYFVLFNKYLVSATIYNLRTWLFTFLSPLSLSSKIWNLHSHAPRLVLVLVLGQEAGSVQTVLGARALVGCPTRALLTSLKLNIKLGLKQMLLFPMLPLRWRGAAYQGSTAQETTCKHHLKNNLVNFQEETISRVKISVHEPALHGMIVM